MKRFNLSVGTKIILPFFFLTLAVASVGAFILTSLVASSLEERINNQLVDAGKMVSAGLVRHENHQLQTLRAVVGTEGMPQALAEKNTAVLATLAPQIIVNSNTDAVVLLDDTGKEVYGWQRPFDGPVEDGLESHGRDFSQIPAVQKALQNEIDSLGDKYVFLTETDEGLMFFTTSPVFFGGETVGAAMVGTYVHRMLQDLTLNAAAHVTLYDPDGRVLNTSLGGGRGGIQAMFRDNPEQAREVLARLAESPETYQYVRENADRIVPYRSLEVFGQRYALAFGDWQMRDQSFGMFSVALPSNFLVNAVATSRSQFTAVFILAVVAVFFGGFIIARRIVVPVNQLVNTAEAVTAGDLDRRSGIHKTDEIGRLAQSFDQMTETLAWRNRELQNKTSQLEAIVNSIADGIIVLDNKDQIISFNPAARRLLENASDTFIAETIQQILAPAPAGSNGNQNTQPAVKQRYEINHRIFTASAAPVKLPDGEKMGTVIVVRDVTQEAEAESLKSAFITSISHELRTPLTIIKLYAHLVEQTGNGQMSDKQRQFIQTINKESDLLEQQINQLINISEIQAGTIRMEEERVDLAALVAQIGAKWAPRYETKGVALSVQLPQVELWVNGDIENLEWAVDNLVNNALQYTPEGGAVGLQVTAVADKVCIAVQDNGIGIAAVDQPHLFERFFRANNEENFTTRGMGLGLYITAKFIDMHQGDIKVESKVGEGSTFTICLPRAG